MPVVFNVAHRLMDAAATCLFSSQYAIFLASFFYGRAYRGYSGYLTTSALYVLDVQIKMLLAAVITSSILQNVIYSIQYC